MSTQKPARVAKVGRSTPKHQKQPKASAERTRGHLRDLARVMLVALAVMSIGGMSLGLMR